ncbi:hypothetical protein Glove_114g12 [Diversispora epigaea]|uniref:SAM domain-containing protein n=1 Tax=Diversispora epigaea TaxID=1348612 RepID=A0A397JA30_9GLOM|nr:hypothetical protein Glove_114g12 [Diversispora epigaea]
MQTFDHQVLVHLRKSKRLKKLPWSTGTAHFPWQNNISMGDVETTYVENVASVEEKEKKKDKLFLKPEYIEIIKYQDIAGQDFLMLTEEKLMQYGLKGGPATRIVQFVKEIKGEEQALQLELEKEKRKRAERSKRLRAETETQMSRFQAQTAHLEVSLNPTTHNLAKTYNLMNPQHRQALWFEPAETLTFYQPPTNNTNLPLSILELLMRYY